jgi:acyl-CoA reductase-like NAD-dependent aldehyde dehydrogenase
VSSEPPLTLFDPATGESTGEADNASEAQVDLAVRCARDAFTSWSRLDTAERANLLDGFAKKIDANADLLAGLEAYEIGRPVSDADAVIRQGADFVRHMATLIDHIGGDVVSADDKRMSLVWRRPRGVVVAITPWNVPCMNVLARVVPAMAAGNTVIVKPSENCPRSAVFLARLAIDAGIPAGVFNVVLGEGRGTGRHLASHRGVDMVVFTGSTQTGLEITRLSATHSLKPVLLECGGKSPLLLMDDVVGSEALWRSIFFSAFWNTGQWCIARTRLIVPRSRLDEVVEGLGAAAAEWSCGDPFNPDTKLGPLANQRQFSNVRRYVEEAGKVGTLTELPVADSGRDARGYFIQPAVVTDIPRSSTVWRDEIFGPLAVIQPFDEMSEAVEFANDSQYGLAATVWTNRTDLAFGLARAIDAGIVDVCARPDSVSSWSPLQYFEPRKQSGLGIDSGLEGLKAYSSAQTVSFAV